MQGRDGNFYGTTPRSYTDGTVFKITPSGTLTTLHTFNGTDGNNPQAGLIPGNRRELLRNNVQWRNKQLLR